MCKKWIQPLQAFVAKSETVEQTSAVAYDVISTEQAAIQAKNNDLSFLHISHAEIDLPIEERANKAKVYEQSKKNLDKLLSLNAMIKENESLFYWYRIYAHNKYQTGLVSLIHTQAFKDNKVKKHELTRADKEEERLQYIITQQAQISPVLLCSDVSPAWKETVQNLNESQAILDLSTNTEERHILWRTTTEETKHIQSWLDAITPVYIADGHHRSAAAVRAAEKINNNPNSLQNDKHNFLLSVIFPSDELQILGYHRVVKDLNGYTKTEFLDKIKQSWNISTLPSKRLPNKQGEICMYLDKTWYSLVEDQQTKKENLPDSLDVSKLYNTVLSPILNIQDIRTDKRIDFIGGTSAINQIQDTIDQGNFAVGFIIYPSQIKDMQSIADQNKIMPPKSTWFEPKLLDGLFFYPFF